MTSSTSNFRKAIVIASVVVLCLTSLEAFTRTVLVRESKDLSRFSTYPARARELMARPGPHVLFLGNSATERGVDSRLAEQELGVPAELFSADSSHINTWIWMMDAEFWKAGRSPELVVIDYFGKSLEDGRHLELGRLAQFFTDRDDWSELFEAELPTLDRRVELVVSSIWATFAFRDRIRDRIFKLIPGYEHYATVENAENNAMDKSEHGATAPGSWSTLQRFLVLARDHHTRVVFVAFPTRSDYELEQPSLDAIRAAGMTHLDLRHVPELDPAKHYDDGIHLNAEGRRIYTLHLVSELKRLQLIPAP
jgi:hypothetical protein